MPVVENLRKVIVRNLPHDTTEEGFMARLDSRVRSSIDYTLFCKGKAANKLKCHDAVPAYIVLHLASKAHIEQLCRQFDGQAFSDQYPTQLVSIEYCPQQRSSWGVRRSAAKYNGTIENDASFKRFLEAESKEGDAVAAPAAEKEAPVQVSPLVAEVIKLYYSSRGGGRRIELMARSESKAKKKKSKEKKREASKDRSKKHGDEGKSGRGKKDKRSRKDKDSKRKDKAADGGGGNGSKGPTDGATGGGGGGGGSGRSKDKDRKDRKKDDKSRKKKKETTGDGGGGRGGGGGGGGASKDIPRPRSETQASTSSAAPPASGKFTVSNTRIMKRPQL